MPTNISRVLLHVLYLEQHGSPRAPNALRELLGAINVRERSAETLPERKTIDLHGAAYIADDPSARAVKVYTGADLVLESTVSGTISDYGPPGWDDASFVYFTLTGNATFTSFDAFSCTQWEKLCINAGGGFLNVTHESGLDFEDNRVRNASGSSNAYEAGEAFWLIRDHVSARWRAKKVTIF